MRRLPRTPRKPVDRQPKRRNRRAGAAIATAGTAVSRATGLLRLGATTYALGVTESRLADTYNLANTTPNMIHELIIGGVLSSVLLRSYIEVKAKEGQEEAWRFIARVTKATMLLLAAIGLIIVVAAPAIFRLYTIGAQGEEGKPSRRWGRSFCSCSYRRSCSTGCPTSPPRR